MVPMTCCIVGLLILAMVGRIRRAVGLRAAEPELFAPVARRAAPGQTVPEPVYADGRAGPASAAVFRYCALGIALCLVAAPALAWLGVLDNTGSMATWLVRGACYGALVGLAVFLSRSTRLLRGIRGAGWFLVVLGAVIFESGVADMHLFRVIEVDHGNMLGDMVFHNVGPVMAAIGALVLIYGAAGRRSTSSRSSRSIVTNAPPSSSAVTVSSTPPVTR